MMMSQANDDDDDCDLEFLNISSFFFARSRRRLFLSLVDPCGGLVIDCVNVVLFSGEVPNDRITSIGYESQTSTKEVGSLATTEGDVNIIRRNMKLISWVEQKTAVPRCQVSTFLASSAFCYELV